MDPASIRHQLYASSTPNTFFASFVPIMKEFEYDTSVRKILRSCFDEWVRYQVMPILPDENLPIHIVGSVGFYFKRYIFDALQKYQLEPGEFIKDPLDQLIMVHAKALKDTNDRY